MNKMFNIALPTKENSELKNMVLVQTMLRKLLDN